MHLGEVFMYCIRCMFKFPILDYTLFLILHLIHISYFPFCRSLIIVLFQGQYPYVILSIWWLQMRIFAGASITYTIKLLLDLWEKSLKSKTMPATVCIIIYVIFKSLIAHINWLSFFLLLLIFRHALLFEGLGGEYNIPMAANARTVREFDEGLTRGNK